MFAGRYIYFEAFNNLHFSKSYEITKNIDLLHQIDVFIFP